MDSFFIKFRGYLALHILKLLILPVPVKYFFAILYLIFSHLTAQIHPFFKKADDLIVYRVQLVP